MHHKGGENEAHKKYYFRYKFMFHDMKEVANNCKDFYQFGLSLYISMVYHKFFTDNVGTGKPKIKRGEEKIF